jgi:hypothetical protein
MPCPDRTESSFATTIQALVFNEVVIDASITHSSVLDMMPFTFPRRRGAKSRTMDAETTHCNCIL